MCKQSSSSVSCSSLLPREAQRTVCEAKELSSTRKTHSGKFTHNLQQDAFNYKFSCLLFAACFFFAISGNLFFWIYTKYE